MITIKKGIKYLVTYKGKYRKFTRQYKTKKAMIKYINNFINNNNFVKNLVILKVEEFVEDKLDLIPFLHKIRGVE